MPALTLDRVSHAFGDLLAVDEVSLTVEVGELVCLLGPSGCGKTTALRVAAGLEPLQTGQVFMGDRLVAGTGVDRPPEERGIGLVFQDYALFPHLSVLDNVGFGLRRLSARERRARALDALAQVDMDDYAGAFPHTLSGGQQQRVALARALAPEPKVMLLDEPFSGLDSLLRNQVRDQTLHILKQSGAATLMVTHDPEEAMFMADRIAVMRRGRVVQLGPPSELYFAPKNSFVTIFFSDINRLESIVENQHVSTPFGQLPAERLAEGTAVEVLIRPEGLHLRRPIDAAEKGAGTARVIAARLLGRTSLIHLWSDAGDGLELHMHARVPGRFLPDEGETLLIEMDRSHTFVFPLGVAT